MIYNELDNSLITYKHDYGVPVNFLAGEDQGFSVGDKIVFVFNTNVIPDKVFTVSASDYSLALKLTEQEAEALFATGLNTFIYSVKRYSESGEFLETLLNGKLLLKETLKWQN